MSLLNSLWVTKNAITGAFEAAGNEVKSLAGNILLPKNKKSMSFPVDTSQPVLNKPASIPITSGLSEMPTNAKDFANLASRSRSLTQTGQAKQADEMAKKQSITPQLAMGNVMSQNAVMGSIGGESGVVKPVIKEAETTIAKPVFQGFKDLSTKILEKLKGRSDVSKQFILDLTKVADLKQVEKDVINGVLEHHPEKVNIQGFADKVKQELLPLNISRPKILGVDRKLRYEGISLPADIKGNISKYDEHIWESPVKTSAGGTHFSGFSDNYFGHTRVEDLADKNTRRVIEVQSDLYQKGNLEAELRNASAYDDLLKRGVVKKTLDQENRAQMSKLQQYNDPTAHFRMVREEVKQAAIDGKTKLQFPTGETAMKIEGLGQEHNTFYDISYNKKYEKLLEKNQYANFEPPQIKQGDLKVGMELGDANQEMSGGDNWIITDVLGDGKFKAVPSEKYNSINELPYSEWKIQKELESYKEEFDIGGKTDTNNPIYKFYENTLGKYLKNKYNAKLITDDRGVNWRQVDLKPEHATNPVEAFGHGQIGSIVGIGAIGASALLASKLLPKKDTSKDLFIQGDKQSSSKVTPPAQDNTKYTWYDNITGNKGTGKSPTPEELSNIRGEVKPTKQATVTLYNPNKNQTDSTPDIGALNRKMEFGDVAIGNRDELNSAKINLRNGKDTFITIPELKDIKTPYGNGVFRINDTKNIRYDGKNNVDIFIPNNLMGTDMEKLIRKNPVATYGYK